ncbi:hypothetical protein ACF061_23730 [Streptomyces sp. NPDC015220]|uniref:hypothetical protein n=1 Tax=Streptomyces sp. NPDC015220 TaxID=3364947 RepID=UPI0036F515B1
MTTAPAARATAPSGPPSPEAREPLPAFLEFALPGHLVPSPCRVPSREPPAGGTRGYDHLGDGRTVEVGAAHPRGTSATHRRRIAAVGCEGRKHLPDQ